MLDCTVHFVEGLLVVPTITLEKIDNVSSIKNIDDCVFQSIEDLKVVQTIYFSPVRFDIRGVYKCSVTYNVSDINITRYIEQEYVLIVKGNY